MLWLKLASTNNDPRVILRHYLLTILEGKGWDGVAIIQYYCVIPLHIGCPTVLRCDKGTENSILAACHMAMRHGHGDSLSGEKSFRYGPSTTNTVYVKTLVTFLNKFHTIAH